MKEAVLLVVVLLSSGLQAEDEPRSKLVKTSQGPVKGYKSSEGDFFVFHGLPYATEPKRRDKFKAPLPEPIWLNTFEAVTKNLACPQENIFLPLNYTFPENCLIANIYVPDTEETNLSVVVMVHGGAYQICNGEFSTPKRIVQEGKIIYVNFNYRLGVHGFLCLGTEDVPGNAGMKDMVALLRWVQKNIAAFGGNPNDVTIDGNSAGSSAVELLMLSQTTRGLFNKIIPQSGSALNTWSVQQNPLQSAKSYAKSLKFESDDFYELEEFFKTASMDKLFSFSTLLREDSDLYFVPCIERDTGSEMFLKDAPLYIYKSGNFPKLPALIGFTNAEGFARAEFFPQFKDKMNERFSDFLPADLKFSTAEEKETVARVVKEFYFEDKPVSEETLQGYIDFFSDIFFTYGILQSVKQQIEAGGDSVYLYQYTYVDKQEVRKFPNVIGAGHCMQTNALYETEFFSPIMAEAEKSADYQRVTAQLRNVWINFIKTGRPVSEGSSIPESWPATSAEAIPYMTFDLTPELKTSRMTPERMLLWDGIYEKYRNTPIPPPTPPPRRTEL